MKKRAVVPNKGQSSVIKARGAVPVIRKAPVVKPDAHIVTTSQPEIEPMTPEKKSWWQRLFG